MSKEEQNNPTPSTENKAKEDFIEVPDAPKEPEQKSNDDFSVTKPVIEWCKANKLKVGIAGGVCVLAIAIIGIAGSASSHKSSHQAKKSGIHQIAEQDGGAYKVQGVTTANTIAKRNTKTYLQEQLTIVSAKLSTIERKMNDQKTVVNLAPIKQELASVATQVNDIAKKSNEYVSIAIKEQTKLLTAQLKDIKQEVNQLKPQADGREKVALKALPFKIVAIDNIQGDDVVSVTYDYRTVPLSLNDTLAGWKLAKVDFTHQSAEFINKHKQYVSFDMNEVAG